MVFVFLRWALRILTFEGSTYGFCILRQALRVLTFEVGTLGFNL